MTDASMREIAAHVVALKRFDITIWVKTESEARKREHWRARHARRKKQREVVAEVLTCYNRAKLVPFPCTVTLTRIAPRPVKDTHDNYPMSLKAVVDEIATWLGVDDGDPQVTWKYAPQQRGRVREYAVRVQIERRQDA